MNEFSQIRLMDIENILPTKKLKRRKNTPRRNMEVFNVVDVYTRFYLGDNLLQGDIKYDDECDPDLENAVNVSKRIQNMLQFALPYRWMLCEFFYSLTDYSFFYGQDDFQMLLEKKMPNFKSRNFTRIEWQKIRSILGKPKRFTDRFINRERSELERMRQIIRYAQLSKIRSDECMPMALDIPDEIPHVLPVNTEVSVLLRSPWVGVYDGIVTAFNSETFTYEIHFYRNEIGTQFINDINIMWKKTYATFSIDEPNWSVKTEFDCIETNIDINENETAPSGEAVQPSPSPERLKDDCINGHSTKLIKALMLLKRTVANKKAIVDKVRELNDEAENILYPKTGQKSVNDSRNSRGTPLELSVEFKERYTSLISSLKKINNNVHEYTNELLTCAPELNPPSDEKMLPDPVCIRDRCRSVAEAAIRHNNKGLVENKNIVSLIEKFSIALLAASVPCTDANMQGVKDIMENFIEETKSLVTEDNVKDFDQLIKVPLNNLRHTNNQ